jgi:hypothetical protein
MPVPLLKPHGMRSYHCIDSNTFSLYRKGANKKLNETYWYDKQEKRLRFGRGRYQFEVDDL